MEYYNEISQFIQMHRLQYAQTNQSHYYSDGFCRAVSFEAAARQHIDPTLK